MAGVAAAICLTPQASALAATDTASLHGAVLSDASQPGLGAALAAERQVGVQHAMLTAKHAKAAAAHHAASLPSWYRVRAGDSLSSIAGRFYHDPAAWPVIYWRNQREIHWANEITAGQELRIPARPARIPAAPAALAPPVPTVRQHVPRHARQAPVHVRSAPVRPAPVQADQVADFVYTGPVPGGAFGRCVVERESGGQTQIMNATGHYGLYQFSAATWAAYGGNPADFGHATVAEQNQVFATALADGGQSNWAPYDGC
jgi:Transglycosylase-like domain/LysM domain